MSENRVAKLDAMAAEVAACTRCGLHAAGRQNTVPGYGATNAEIMFIGEAPGAEEDKQGLPFVGRSGQYLDYLLDKILGITRDKVFIANVIKCRPPQNRDPVSDEIIACKPYLERQIQLIDPLVIATLGRFSMGLFFPNAKISRIHGQPRFEDNRAYFPFYHPAAALRNPPLRHDMERDMKKLMETVEQVKAKRAGESEISQDDDPPDDEPPEPKQLRLF